MKSKLIKTIGLNISLLLLLSAVATPIAMVETRSMIDPAQRTLDLSGVTTTSAR